MNATELESTMISMTENPALQVVNESLKSH